MDFSEKKVFAAHAMIDADKKKIHQQTTEIVTAFFPKDLSAIIADYAADTNGIMLESQQKNPAAIYDFIFLTINKGVVEAIPCTWYLENVPQGIKLLEHPESETTRADLGVAGISRAALSVMDYPICDIQPAVTGTTIERLAQLNPGFTLIKPGSAVAEKRGSLFYLPSAITIKMLRTAWRRTIKALPAERVQLFLDDPDGAVRINKAIVRQFKKQFPKKSFEQLDQDLQK